MKIKANIRAILQGGAYHPFPRGIYDPYPYSYYNPEPVFYHAVVAGILNIPVMPVLFWFNKTLADGMY